jgi:hypothetical protein
MMECLKIDKEMAMGTYDVGGKASNEEKACIKMASVCSLMRQKKAAKISREIASK